MPAATFDGVNLIVDLPAPTGGLLTIDVQEDIYSDWKVWVKGTGHMYPPAFDVTGGDPIPGATITGSYFLRNDLGWRIRSTDENQEVTLVGNLYPRDSSLDVFVPRASRTITFNVDRTASPRQVTSGSGVTQQDKDDIEAQIFAHIMENSETFAEQVRLMRADSAGKIVQQADGTYAIRDAADAKDRITGDDSANSGRDITAVDGT